MPSDTKTRTILLADLVGSTQQITRLETEQSANFIQDATQPIRDAVQEQDGQIIKFTGDGYLSTFESANDALEAADSIRNFFLRQRYTPNGIALDGVRVVVHTADIVVQENDIVGDGVIVVSRLEKYVPTNAIWLTAATREVCTNPNFLFEDMGEVELRGRARAVRAYALHNSEANYLEKNLTLVITDLHRYVEAGENLSPNDLNNWLLKWGNFHREAIQGLKGRIRHFMADMALLTFVEPDDAFRLIMNLKTLVEIHNRHHQAPMLPYHFKAALCSGDLILSPTGIVGPLVNHAFAILNQTPRTHLGISESAYQRLAVNYQEQLRPDSQPGSPLFTLALE